MIVLTNGEILSDERELTDYLEQCGFSPESLEDISGMLQYNEVQELRSHLNCADSELRSYEASLDSLHSALNEIQNICDEKLKMQRISKARETFEAISKLIYNYC